MTAYTMISLIALLMLGAVAYMFSHNHRTDSTEQPVTIGESNCATCTSGSFKCEQECMMEAAMQPIDYFDDEELDVFKGRDSHGYTDEEAEQFADILHTMNPDEVAAWNRSLTLRGINLPDELKDEVILLMREH